MKNLIKNTANHFGLQIAGKERLGINFWHDFRRINIDAATVFDVGANIGQWATECRNALPQATIHSFEPEPVSFGSLAGNFRNDSNHFPHQYALSTTDGHATLTISECPLMHSLDSKFDSRPTGSVEVATRTIDSMVMELSLSRLPLLKIDVEGHEIACLKGAIQSLEEGLIDVVFIEAGFAGGVHTRLCKIEDFLFPYDLQFLSIYDIYPSYNKPKAFFCNALFVRDGLDFR